MKDIEELGLSVKTNSILKNAGIETAEELTRRTKRDIEIIRGISRRSMDEITERMRERGLEFAEKEEKNDYIPNADACPECGRRGKVRNMKMGAAWAITCDECGYTVGPCVLLQTAVKKWSDESKAAAARREGTGKTPPPAVVEIPIEQLMNHPRNIRKAYTDIDDLADSIKARGIMQNLTVVPAEDKQGLFYVIIGNRRLQAAKKAGLKSLPCAIVWDMSEREQFSIMVTENMQRADLTIEEQAESFQLMLDLGETVGTIHEKTGLSETTVRHRLKLAELGIEALRKRRKKEEDTSSHYLQLTLEDYAYLEKIKDVEVRRSILDSTQGSKELRWSVDSELVKIAKKNCIDTAEKRFKALGIKKNPNGSYNYEDKEIKKFSDWNEKTAAEIRRWEPPEGTETKELYWCEGYDAIRVKRKVKKNAAAEESDAEKERKLLARNRKQLGDLGKAFTKEIRTFTGAVCRGKYGKPENEEAFVKAGLKVILTQEISYFDLDRIAAVFVDYKDVYGYGIDPERKRETLELETWKIILLGVVASTQNSITEIACYPCDYTARYGEKAKSMIEVLKKFGYQPSNLEYIQLIDGTHELYRRKEPVMPEPETEEEADE